MGKHIKGKEDKIIYHFYPIRKEYFSLFLNKVFQILNIPFWKSCLTPHCQQRKTSLAGVILRTISSLVKIADSDTGYFFLRSCRNVSSHQFLSGVYHHAHRYDHKQFACSLLANCRYRRPLFIFHFYYHVRQGIKHHPSISDLSSNLSPFAPFTFTYESNSRGNFSKNNLLSDLLIRHNPSNLINSTRKPPVYDPEFMSQH